MTKFECCGSDKGVVLSYVVVSVGDSPAARVTMEVFYCMVCTKKTGRDAEGSLFDVKCDAERVLITKRAAQ